MEERPDDTEVTSEEEAEELRDSAASMGVDDADDRDPDDIVDEVRHAQADSEVSPSEWKVKDDD